MSGTGHGIGRTAAALAFAVVLAAVQAAAAQEILYGSTARSDGGYVGTVDQGTGAFSSIGSPVETGPLPGFALSSLGQAFVSNNTGTGGSNSVGVLLRIDLSNGTLLETIGTITDTADDTPMRISSLAFQPGTDTLYGIAAKGTKEGFLFRISTTTAAATKVGETGLPRGGIAFTPDGRLYLATADDPQGLFNAVIARIDPDTAAVIGTPQEIDIYVEGLAVRPSDGVFFANYADSSTLYTLDPADGTTTPVGPYGGSFGHVSDMAFPAGPATPETRGFLVPETAKLRIVSSRPERSQLALDARLDTCCDVVDLAGDLTIDVNGLVLDLSGGRLNRKGTRLSFKDGATKVVVKTGLGGTSRGSVSIRLKRDLDGIAEPDGDVDVRLSGGGLDVAGTATLSGTRFRRSKGDGAEGSWLVPLSIRGRAADPQRSSVTATFAYLGDTSAGGSMPDVDLAIGAYAESFDGDLAIPGRDSVEWRSKGSGVTLLRLDAARRLITVRVELVTLGYESGPLRIRMRIGESDGAVIVTPRASGSSFRY